MDTNGVVTNGSLEPDNDTKEEKILKPRKPGHSDEQERNMIQNGNSENGSLSDFNVENDNIENGYDEETGSDSAAKSNAKRSEYQPNPFDKQESSLKKPLKKRESTAVKENTPKPEIPSKRELRRRENTPKPVTPTKHEQNRRGAPKVHLLEKDQEPKPPQVKVQQQIDVNKATVSHIHGEVQTNENSTEEIDITIEESVVIIEEDSNGESIIVNIDDHDIEAIEIIETEPQENGFFSVFRRNSRGGLSIEMKDTCEASSSSPSIICIGTPSTSDEKYPPSSSDIKSRKPINSFSRFPGRTVSVTSIDNSLKRKADDSFDGEELKRFAGSTDSGSTKSPGWRFFSPSLSRVWSPAALQTKSPIPSSTPFSERVEQDSMTVNYNEESKLSVEGTTAQAEEDPAPKPRTGNWCTIM